MLDMNHSYSYYPTLLSKDIDGVTKANSHTEKHYSHFQPTQDEVVHHNVRFTHDPRKFITSQKTLIKVKSMPLTIFNPQNDVFHHSNSGQIVEIRNQPLVRETANINNRRTKYLRNSSLENLSSTQNKLKSYDVSRQFHPNVQIREDKLSQSTLRNSGVYSIPIPSVRFPLQQNQIIHTSFNNKNINPLFGNNQSSRPTIVFQNPRYISFGKSKYSELYQDKSQFLNNIPNTSQIQNKYEKISFTKLQQNSQQRSHQQKIHRYIGQDVQQKQNNSICSKKVFPIIVVIIFLFVMASVLIGLGMMTGLFSERNHLTTSEVKQQTKQPEQQPKPQQETLTQPSQLPEKSIETQPIIPLPVQPIPIQNLPITIPSISTIPSQNTSTSKESYIDAQPISLEKAKEIIDIIIQENHEVVPQNYRFTLRKDILYDVQQLPVNQRDVTLVQKISYQHLQALVNSDPKHQKSIIIYRHHEVQKTI